MAIDLDALLDAPNSVVDSEENDNLEAPPRPMMTMYEAMALIAVCVECDCEDIIADLAEAGAFVWPEPPLIPDERLNLDAITESDCILRFRFTARSIISIADMLGLPAIIITKHRYRVLGYEALAMILRRFAFPGRLYELVQEFGRSATAICRILIETMSEIHSNYRNLIYLHAPLLIRNADMYVEACIKRGCPLKGVGCFVDGTKQGVCRPGQSTNHVLPENFQQAIYSGHKRQHCFNYQGAVVPDGLLIHFWGPFDGRRHDSTMMRESRFIEALDSCRELDNFFVYGDPAYGCRGKLYCGFKGSNLSESQALFNTKMSSLRQSIEWWFGILKSIFPFVVYNKAQKVFLSPVGIIMQVAVLLVNVHTCYSQGNIISDFFSCTPPSVKEFLMQ